MIHSHRRLKDYTPRWFTSKHHWLVSSNTKSPSIKYKQRYQNFNAYQGYESPQYGYGKLPKRFYHDPHAWEAIINNLMALGQDNFEASKWKQMQNRKCRNHSHYPQQNIRTHSEDIYQQLFIILFILVYLNIIML